MISFVHPFSVTIRLFFLFLSVVGVNLVFTRRLPIVGLQSDYKSLEWIPFMTFLFILETDRIRLKVLQCTILHLQYNIIAWFLKFKHEVLICFVPISSTQRKIKTKIPFLGKNNNLIKKNGQQCSGSKGSKPLAKANREY